MEFKVAEKQDLEQIYGLVQETIKAAYPKYYLKEIVDMFCEFHSRDNILKDIEEINTSQSVDTGKLELSELFCER